MRNQQALEEWLKGRELDLMTIDEKCVCFNRDMYIDMTAKLLQGMRLDKAYKVKKEDGMYMEYKIKFQQGVLVNKSTTYEEFLKKYHEIEKPKILEEMMKDLDSGIQYIVYGLPMRFFLEELTKDIPEFLKYDYRFVSPDSMIIERGGTKPFDFRIFNNLVLTFVELEELILTYKNHLSKEKSETREKMVECMICWSDKDNNNFIVVAAYGDQLIMEEVSHNSKKKRYVVDKNTREILFKFKEA